MAKVPGRITIVKIDDNDISTYCSTSEIDRKRGSADTTGYGAEAVARDPTLKDVGPVTLGGTYDSAEGGPRGVLEPLYDSGEKVAFIRQTEGTGTGKPQDSMTVFVSDYKETNPVADMVAWSAELTVDGDVDTTPQS